MTTSNAQRIVDDANAIAQTSAALKAANARAADMVRWLKTQAAATEDVRVNLFALSIVEKYLCELMERLYGVPAVEVAVLARQTLVELAEVEE